MNPSDTNMTERNKVARYAWQVTAAIVVLFVVAPFLYTTTQQGGGNGYFDPLVNTIDLVGIGGCMSAISFFVLAIMFRPSGRSAQKRSPSAMRRSLDQGLILTAFYWMLFVALTHTGGDGDGIMRGWMVILYPVVLISYVLHTSRRLEDPQSTE